MSNDTWTEQEREDYAWGHDHDALTECIGTGSRYHFWMRFKHRDEGGMWGDRSVMTAICCGDLILLKKNITGLIALANDGMNKDRDCFTYHIYDMCLLKYVEMDDVFQEAERRIENYHLSYPK